MARKVAESHSVAYFDHASQVNEPGFYLLEGDAETDENGTKHETNMKPGQRVYSSPDGEGFVYEPPKEGDE